ncbi:MAG: hypothetical protein EZS28_036185, partial [Streblomastix strix]
TEGEEERLSKDPLNDVEVESLNDDEEQEQGAHGYQKRDVGIDTDDSAQVDQYNEGGAQSSNDYGSNQQQQVRSLHQVDDQTSPSKEKRNVRMHQIETSDSNLEAEVQEIQQNEQQRRATKQRSTKSIHSSAQEEEGEPHSGKIHKSKQRSESVTSDSSDITPTSTSTSGSNTQSTYSAVDSQSDSQSVMSQDLDSKQEIMELMLKKEQLKDSQSKDQKNNKKNSKNVDQSFRSFDDDEVIGKNSKANKQSPNKHKQIKSKHQKQSKLPNNNKVIPSDAAAQKRKAKIPTEDTYQEGETPQPPEQDSAAQTTYYKSESDIPSREKNSSEPSQRKSKLSKSPPVSQNKENKSPKSTKRKSKGQKDQNQDSRSQQSESESSSSDLNTSETSSETENNLRESQKPDIQDALQSSSDRIRQSKSQDTSESAPQSDEEQKQDQIVVQPNPHKQSGEMNLLNKNRKFKEKITENSSESLPPSIGGMEEYVALNIPDKQQ